MTTYARFARRIKIMEKNTLESALKEFSQTSGTNANDVKEFFALMSDGSIKRMPKEDMATVLGGLHGIKRIAYLNSQRTNKIVISNKVGYVLGAIVHYMNKNRTTELAILRLSYSSGTIDSPTTHVVEKIFSSNTGTGFTVSEDGSYINADGLASNKSVILVGILTDFELE